jgi:hypothetical protein
MRVGLGLRGLIAAEFESPPDGQTSERATDMLL